MPSQVTELSPEVAQRLAAVMAGTEQGASQPAGSPLLLRVSQVAFVLNVHKATVYRTIASEDLRGFRLKRGGVRVPLSALIDYLNSSTIGTAKAVA